MKKILCLLLTMALCASLVACGGKETTTDEGATDVTKDAASENVDSPEGFGIGKVVETEEAEKPVDNSKKVEKTIDAVAEALGLSNGKKNFYDKIGAIDGKEYNGGNVVLYQYDEAGEKYQEILNGNGSSRIAAYKNGIVLLFPVGATPNSDMIKAFNELNIAD